MLLFRIMALEFLQLAAWRGRERAAHSGKLARSPGSGCIHLGRSVLGAFLYISEGLHGSFQVMRTSAAKYCKGMLCPRLRECKESGSSPIS